MKIQASHVTWPLGNRLKGISYKGKLIHEAPWVWISRGTACLPMRSVEPCPLCMSVEFPFLGSFLLLMFWVNRLDWLVVVLYRSTGRCFICLAFKTLSSIHRAVRAIRLLYDVTKIICDDANPRGVSDYGSNACAVCSVSILLLYTTSGREFKANICNTILYRKLGLPWLWFA